MMTILLGRITGASGDSKDAGFDDDVDVECDNDCDDGNDDCGVGDCGDDGVVVRAAAAVVQAKQSGEKPRGATQLCQTLTLSSPQSSSASVAQNFNELRLFFTMPWA